MRGTTKGTPTSVRCALSYISSSGHPCIRSSVHPGIRSSGSHHPYFCFAMKSPVITRYCRKVEISLRHASSQ